MKYLLLLLLSFPVYADQISYQESAQLSNQDHIYTSADRRLQYNYGDKKYGFLQIRKMGVCPDYCGVDFLMLGLGLGVNHNFGVLSVFAQGGYYFVKNSAGVTKDDENLYYYFRAHPEFGTLRPVKSYEVKTDNAISFTVGMDIPYNKNAGFKLSYQYLKIKQNIIARFTDDPNSLNLWWVPQNYDYSSINAGIYIKF